MIYNIKLLFYYSTNNLYFINMDCKDKTNICFYFLFHQEYSIQLKSNNNYILFIYRNHWNTNSLNYPCSLLLRAKITSKVQTLPIPKKIIPQQKYFQPVPRLSSLTVFYEKPLREFGSHAYTPFSSRSSFQPTHTYTYPLASAWKVLFWAPRGFPLSLTRAGPETGKLLRR